MRGIRPPALFSLSFLPGSNMREVKADSERWAAAVKLSGFKADE
jgi:hypothetical protein